MNAALSARGISLGHFLGCFLLAWVLAATAAEAAAPEASRSETAALNLGVEIGHDGLPGILSKQDVALYREIFALQEKGKWKAADKRIAQLSDRRLMGHVLHQRYMHPTAYRSRYKELKGWMAEYADHPGAKRVYDLALKRRPQNYKHPRRPIRHANSLNTAGYGKGYRYKSSKPRSRAERRRVYQLKRQIRRNVLRTRLSISEELLQTREVRRLFDTVEIDEAKARIAAAWFYYNKPQKAFDLAHEAAERSGKFVSEAHWIAGLAAWRMGRPEAALPHFEALALSERSSNWLTTSGAYWAARASLRLRQPQAMSQWLRRAAEHPRTFYGILAQRALGMEIRFNFHSHEMDVTHFARLAAVPAGVRAMALLQVGRSDDAQRELLALPGLDDPQIAEALLALADVARLPTVAYRLGNSLVSAGRSQTTGAIDAALYPLPPWQPRSGFKVDRALIYALMRQESNFNPRAKSPDGARGLMQLMPRTASFISTGQRYRGRKRNELFEPSLNLELGQRYINHLLDHNLVEGNLFRMAAAYNGGPGNLNKWQRRMRIDDDPLLFIESLPSRETRLFIERVLTNLWIYRQRLKQSAPSLDGAAAGNWPVYQAQDALRAEVAQNVAN